MTTITFGRSVGVVSLAIAGFFGGTLAYAQPGPPPPFDAAARSAAVATAAEALRSRYVSPEVGDRAAAAIEAALKNGDYDDLAQPQAFAEKLTADLRAVTHDLHVQVLGGGPPPGAARGPPPRTEGGVVRGDRLAGNVGYIEIVMLGPPPLFNPALDRAMAALNDTTALIVDARDLAGGTMPSVSYLVSYFVRGGERVHLGDIESRNPGTETFRTEEIWSVPTPLSYARPVYVLTSVRTLSAGETFVYDLQAMRRATVVGETTAGGAHAAAILPLGPGLALMVAAGRQKNAITGTDWEGVGVKPDVAAPSADALKVALEKLGGKPAATEIEALSQARVFAPRSTPQPGGEAAVRRLSEENARGEPNYDLMSPEMAQATRAQIDRLKQIFSSFGPIKSVKFVQVDPQGVDTYEVEYASNTAQWQILLGPDGKTVLAGFRAAPPKPPAAAPN